MANRINYQKQLDKLIERLEGEGRVPSLLLHSCCAPCSSYCIEYLSKFFHVTVFYYNPNIYPEIEYKHREEEQIRLISSMQTSHPVRFLKGDFDASRFYAAVKGLEHEPECGARCEVCYRLRLSKTADMAAQMKFDYFATTLSISPLKDAQKLNEIGQDESKRTKALFLPSDFKKKEGYKRSIELSAQYGLYRQDYCGCVFSRRERQMHEEKQQKADPD